MTPYSFKVLEQVDTFQETNNVTRLWSVEGHGTHYLNYKILWGCLLSFSFVSPLLSHHKFEFWERYVQSLKKMNMTLVNKHYEDGGTLRWQSLNIQLCRLDKAPLLNKHY